MSLKIIKAGIQDSLQDLGRYGYQQLGINPTGAMDKFSMQVSNALVGNEPGEPVIEMHFPASVYLFTEPALIAISGADFHAHINGEPIPHLHPLLVAKNDLLHFKQPHHGGRAYLSVRGGFEHKPWLGSGSTHLKAHAGGLKGRPLRKDDEIRLRKAFPPDLLRKDQEFMALPWQADVHWQEDPHEIYILPGHEWGSLIRESKENLFMTSFVITQQSDRMGYRLNHTPLHMLRHEEVVSSAVDFGTIQLLPDGHLIILMADHQTTGGYPRIGHCITAHHHRLAQLGPGDKIRFRLTDQQTAEQLLYAQHTHLRQLAYSCRNRLDEYLKKLHVPG